MRHQLTVLVVVTALVLAGCSTGSDTGAPAHASGNGNGGDLGYSVGGAKDVNNFRDNVQEGKLPLATDVTHEGLYYDYAFDTGEPERCEQLFCPTYDRAVTEDPLSNETEYFATVGLNSNQSVEDFERKKLNLVLVVDVSGSMDAPFDRYYYDEEGEKRESERRRKMAAARESIQGLLDHLDDGDRVGIVAYDDDARTVVEMEAVGDRDMEHVRTRVDELRAGGGTNLAAGMDEARSMIEPHADADASEYENRIVYVTDAMPNVDAGADGLESRLSGDAEDGVHTTFVGVGIDFNSRLVETVSDVRGANYYSVHSAEQFRERMDEQFEYMVTPLVFDLSLTVDSEGWEIARVYGTQAADEATGELLHVNTLFPSPTTNGSTKGGVVLVQLERTGEAESIELTASYEDRTGADHETTRVVTFEERDPEYFESPAVRKAVLLSRYANLMGNWVAYERAELADATVEDPSDGIEDREGPELGEWERRSTDLQVSPVYRERIEIFGTYFEREMAAIGDDDLQQELDLLETLAEHGAETDTDATGTPNVDATETPDTNATGTSNSDATETPSADGASNRRTVSG